MYKGYAMKFSNEFGIFVLVRYLEGNLTTKILKESKGRKA
jgi:hypothetical protein